MIILILFSFFFSVLAKGNNTTEIQIPKSIDQFVLDQLIYEQLNGFLLILTGNGKIVFVSYSVEHILGHLQVLILFKNHYETNH